MYRLDREMEYYGRTDCAKENESKREQEAEDMRRVKGTKESLKDQK